MTTLTEYQNVITSMQHLVDEYGLPQFDGTECWSALREVVFLWKREKLAVIVELDDDLTTEQQVAAQFAQFVGYAMN